ncbi:hypothetical protein GQ55_5G412700 [Panicum hallii var. hallii]|uniref:Uncharacterized protein n=1 Tax=Panicum hallii var. hallii TaxID=1504633 RepID=A0A2T7DNR8_9POAL|nr:hypothetical protein GQ55_5G412700 [Panicum hallii var. hallii]
MSFSFRLCNQCFLNNIPFRRVGARPPASYSCRRSLPFACGRPFAALVVPAATPACELLLPPLAPVRLAAARSPPRPPRRGRERPGRSGSPAPSSQPTAPPHKPVQLLIPSNLLCSCPTMRSQRCKNVRLLKGNSMVATIFSL